jgi:hypothetical protein
MSESEQEILAVIGVAEISNVSDTEVIGLIT